MIVMKNFKSKNVEINGLNISVATDETGADWYESQKNFADDTLKIVFNSADVIVSMSHDVSALWPAGNSVAEIAVADIPGDVDINGGWFFDGKKITARVYSREELIAQATVKRDSLMAVATAAIAPLQDAVDIDDATDDEIALLKAWKTYRVALSRLDLTIAPDIAWPDAPQ
ncbi:tail fiber assembly protein [Enterobacter asburiae]|uniref:tail fiber assembly protein n=1 Tax=Enterobacter asburiae TaxID=61645 RepID=UPI0011D22851|nr:tail fiber assembly protein [Enterobacter asburiae]